MARVVNEEQRGQRKQQILEAACRCLQKKSYAVLTIRDVANEVGVATGLVHYYFSGKEALLRETAVFVTRYYENVMLEELDQISAPFTTKTLMQFFRHYHERIYSENDRCNIHVLFELGTFSHFDAQLSEALRSRDYTDHVSEKFNSLLPAHIDGTRFYQYLITYMEGINVMVCLYGYDYKEILAYSETLLAAVLPTFGIE